MIPRNDVIHSFFLHNLELSSRFLFSRLISDLILHLFLIFLMHIMEKASLLLLFFLNVLLAVLKTDIVFVFPLLHVKVVRILLVILLQQVYVLLLYSSLTRFWTFQNAGIQLLVNHI